MEVAVFERVQGPWLWRFLQCFYLSGLEILLPVFQP
jgi:hypothetical protein